MIHPVLVCAGRWPFYDRRTRRAGWGIGRQAGARMPKPSALPPAGLPPAGLMGIIPPRLQPLNRKTPHVITNEEVLRRLDQLRKGLVEMRGYL